MELTPVKKQLPENIRPVPGTLMLSGDKIFYTIQGEGSTLGKPAVFLRLHFCNLHCVWCDTRYAWDKTTQEFWSEPEAWEYEKIVKEIKKYPTDRLVITGGEPLLQQRGIENLLELLPDMDVEIETNGTITPSDYLLGRCQFNCSPKLANSENLPSDMYHPDVLKILAKFGKEGSCFKFVFIEEGDLPEIEAIVEDCQISRERIYLMPEGTTRENILGNLLKAIEVAKMKGWNVTPRLQVFAWGAVRRV